LDAINYAGIIGKLLILEIRKGGGWGIPLCPDPTFGSGKSSLTIAIIGLPGNPLGLKKMPGNSP
jgi:hypothetical protein